MTFFSKVIRWCVIGCVLMAYQGCINVYDPSLALNANLVVVSGIITDLNEVQTINLSRSRSNADSINVSIPIQRARVNVVVMARRPFHYLKRNPAFISFRLIFGVK